MGNVLIFALYFTKCRLGNGTNFWWVFRTNTKYRSYMYSEFVVVVVFHLHSILTFSSFVCCLCVLLECICQT